MKSPYFNSIQREFMAQAERVGRFHELNKITAWLRDMDPESLGLVDNHYTRRALQRIRDVLENEFHGEIIPSEKIEEFMMFS